MELFRQLAFSLISDIRIEAVIQYSLYVLQLIVVEVEGLASRIANTLVLLLFVFWELASGIQAFPHLHETLVILVLIDVSPLVELRQNKHVRTVQ